MEDRKPTTLLSRRELAALGLGGLACRAATPAETHQATGCKVGEMSPESASVWVRRTAANTRLANGIVRVGHQEKAGYLAAGERAELLEGACPGASGWARVRYEGGGRRGATQWRGMEPGSDFAEQFPLAGLKPATEYSYVVETSATRGGRVDGELTGKFKTLPLPSAAAPVRGALLSCQMYAHKDRADGFHIYRSIEKWAPDFLLSCGDNVYYDNEDPIASNEAVARYHWDRMYSMPTLVDCLRSVGGYWQKDDHDVLSDDAWPSMKSPKMRELTFAAGQKIFRQQVPAPPAGKPLYRTVRVGADVELWLPEARDYRSANTDPDGPEHSIWGAAQKKWLMDSLASSRAAWKIIVNPNPLVGPDRKNKKDNHSNGNYVHEGGAFRRWVRNNFDGNVISVCGDRHWQYHSVEPESGLHEFGCGAASDEHAGGTPGFNPQMHRFHRVKGGYLTIEAERNGGQSLLWLRHRDVHGTTVNEQVFSRRC